ncbi:MAG: hypothetical protein K0B52_05535 [FCB group bacterium]|nr:hypothetical protein [FCB group bacterium]
MKFLKFFSLFLLACVVLYLAVGIFLPKSATLERKAEIHAPAGLVLDSIIELYNDHIWPIWEHGDTSIVFTPLENANGYRWEGQKVAYGECEYFIEANNILRDVVRFRGQEIAQTVWTLEGSFPVQLHLRFTIHAGNNIGTRWTNLFIERMAGLEIDNILERLRNKVEPEGIVNHNP